MCTEMGGGMPRPARTVEDRPCKRDQIGIASTDNGFGLLKLGDESDGDHRNARCVLHGAREWHLITRPDWDPLGRSETAARNVNGGAAARLQLLRKGDRLINVPAVVRPVSAGQAHRNRAVGWEGGAHRVKDFERK